KKVFVSLERLLSIFTDAVLCVSKKDREDARNIIGIRDNKLHYIRNGVYPKVKNENTKTEKFLRIIFLGRLTKPKRPDLLIEAVKGMDNVKLDIIGSGDLECQLPLYDNVSFLGEVEGFDNFCNYDLFALISDSEGMPMSALEAASAGVPIVISDVGGCSEIITDNGILVLNDVYSIRKAIEHIIENYNEIKGNSLRAAKYFDIN
ncbi:glycosyltransferase, partial [Vibrio parahaemolyticus]|nr:glycosyltransferase [Vibrio parahaemolyticus]